MICNGPMDNLFPSTICAALKFEHCVFGFADFELSDVQQEHALAVERLAPALAALRMELCPEHMSEAHFWMIYFVLLHPRLNKHDAELLSTPKVGWFYADSPF